MYQQKAFAMSCNTCWEIKHGNKSSHRHCSKL